MRTGRTMLTMLAVGVVSLMIVGQASGRSRSSPQSGAPVSCPACRINFGIAGITRTQTMRINVADLSDVPPGPCRQVEMGFFDVHGNILRRSSQCVSAGQAVSFDLNGASIESSTIRRAIRAAIRLDPPGDSNAVNIVATVEVFDNETGKTAFLVPVSAQSAPGDFSLAVIPNSVSVQSGSQVGFIVDTSTTIPASQTVSLSVSGLPAGASATFSPVSITSGSSSSLTVSTGCAVSGTYILTVTGTGTSATHVTFTTLTIN